MRARLAFRSSREKRTPAPKNAAAWSGAIVLILLVSSTLSAQDDEVKRKYFSEVHKALAIASGATVADVGTGSDTVHPLAIAQVVGTTGRVLCIDIDQKALDTLKKNLPKGTSNIDVQLGKSDDPMLDAASIDAVLISSAYHEMTQPREVLAHIRDALKPKGRLVIIESYKESRRRLSRQEQVDKHELPPDIIEDELRAARFEIVARVQPLLIDGETIKYLLAAQVLDADRRPPGR